MSVSLSTSLLNSLDKLVLIYSVVLSLLSIVFFSLLFLRKNVREQYSQDIKQISNLEREFLSVAGIWGIFLFFIALILVIVKLLREFWRFITHFLMLILVHEFWI
jgi:hypothetical protein